LASLGIPSKVLYTPGQIDHHVFVYWPYILKSIENSIDLDSDNLKMASIHSETLDLLSRTVSIPIGLNVTMDMASSLVNEIFTYFNSEDLAYEHN
jgi:hypothetical protein